MGWEGYPDLETIPETYPVHIEHAFSHIPTVALRVMNAGVYKAHKCYNIEPNGNEE